MYSDVKSVQYLVAMLKEYDIRNIVLSAGTRQIAVAASVEADPFFQCYSIVDERSAAFFALGIIQETKKPCVIVCTSGTASCNYLSATAEAYYQHRKLIVITMDREPCMLNQREDQMIPQFNMYCDIVKSNIVLPVIKDDSDARYCIRLLNEAFLQLYEGDGGPIHINVPVLPGMESSVNTENLPEIPRIRIIQKDSDVADIKYLLKNKRILIQYGRYDGPDEEEVQLIEKFVQLYDAVVVCDHLSNINSSWVVKPYYYLHIARWEDFWDCFPDIVILMNGITSLELKSSFKGSTKEFESWLVSLDGNIEDPYYNLRNIFKMDNKFFFKKCIEENVLPVSSHPYLHKWKTYVQLAEVGKLKYTDIYVIKNVLERIPENTILFLGNSSTIRFAQYFEIKDSIKVFCNFEKEGIDGTFSSFMGHAAINKALSFLIIGDLSFFYDMNAIWNNYIGNHIRILLNNNMCGALMHYYTGETRYPLLNKSAAAMHETSAKGWAESRGFLYLSAHNEKEFNRELEKFMVLESEKPIIFEVFTDVKVDKAEYDRISSREAFGDVVCANKNMFEELEAESMAIESITSDNDEIGVHESNIIEQNVDIEKESIVEELERIKNSYTYKVGMAFLYLPKKIMHVWRKIFR